MSDLGVSYQLEAELVCVPGSRIEGLVHNSENNQIRLTHGGPLSGERRVVDIERPATPGQKVPSCLSGFSYLGAGRLVATLQSPGP
jgi:hypothetical protein